MNFINKRSRKKTIPLPPPPNFKCLLVCLLALLALLARHSVTQHGWKRTIKFLCE